MARDHHLFEILENRRLTQHLVELVTEWRSGAKPFQFQTGQFLMLQVPGERSPNGKSVQRAYSIASSHKSPQRVHLMIKLVPQGIASGYVATLKPGESVDCTGPFGKCFFKTPPPQKVVFLCTGAGLSQHYSMLTSEGVHYPNVQYRLLIGVWTPQETFYQKELQSLQQKLPSFEYDFVVDKPGADWKGLTGYVTDHLEACDIKPEDTHVYLCGNPAMIDSAKELLYNRFGMPKDRVIIEAFNFVRA